MNEPSHFYDVMPNIEKAKRKIERQTKKKK